MTLRAAFLRNFFHDVNSMAKVFVTCANAYHDPTGQRQPYLEDAAEQELTICQHIVHDASSLFPGDGLLRWNDRSKYMSQYTDENRPPGRNEPGAFVLGRRRRFSSGLLHMNQTDDKVVAYGIHSTQDVGLATAILLFWLIERKALFPALEQIDVSYHATHHQGPTMVTDKVMLYLRAYMLKVFDTTIQEFTLQEDIPWSWQHPLLVSEYIERLHNPELLQQVFEVKL